ncbi:hypothetical protein GY45DRAFT_183790 [Cubamyces sp. BRFM 1775]|nr:hypothetical protein GY45DRAFT_183790 [Cubamyces sp. BRFM 1775]
MSKRKPRKRLRRPFGCKLAASCYFKLALAVQHLECQYGTASVCRTRAEIRKPPAFPTAAGFADHGAPRIRPFAMS